MRAKDHFSWWGVETAQPRVSAFLRGNGSENHENRIAIRTNRFTRNSHERIFNFQSVIDDLLPNRKCMWHERADLLFTDIFVRTLSECHTNLWLLPRNRSPTLSSLVPVAGWMGVRRPILSFLFHVLPVLFFHYLLYTKRKFNKLT